MKRILLIEDNRSDSMLFKSALHGRAQIIEKKSLRDALDVDPFDFDLIISDLSLPDAYHTEVIQGLKDTFPQKPIVILSGLGLSQDEADIEENLKEKGVFAFVHKEHYRKISNVIQEV